MVSTLEQPREESPFWRFSLRFYSRPGVAAACLALQDEAGADVNLMLFLLFLAKTTHRPISKLALSDLGAQNVRDFLAYLEAERGNGIRSRNHRLAMLHTFFVYVGAQAPELLREAERVAAIPTKRTQPPATRYLVALTIVAAMAWIASNIVHGRIGRAWMAVRDMDIAAELIGIRLLRVKLLAFAVHLLRRALERPHAELRPGQPLGQPHGLVHPAQPVRLGKQTADELTAFLAAEGIAASGRFASPLQAFRHAQDNAGDDDRILVFGSFQTVADILREVA